MTTIIRAGSSAEFLSLVPHLAGYVPQRSVVLVPFQGTRTAGLLRFDLPPREPDAFAATAVGTVCRLPAVDGIALVVYSDEPTAADALPHGALAARLRERADACGLVLGESLVVGPDGWASYVDGSRHGLDELTPPPAADLAPLRASQDAGVTLPRVPSAERQSVRAAVRTLERTAGSLPPAQSDVADPVFAAIDDAFDDPVRFWEQMLDAEPSAVPPAHSALLLWSLRRPVFRDVALACWTRGPAYADDLFDFQLAWRHGDPPPNGPLFLAGEGPRPDAERLMRALALVRRLAALGETEHRTAALACAGWLSWALGLGTHAHAYARRARRADPTLGLAEIVLTLATAGRLPDWAFDHGGVT